MSQPPITFRPAIIVTTTMSNNGGGKNKSHRLAQICDRYIELLRRASLPVFTKAELDFLVATSDGANFDPAPNVRGSLWTSVENDLLYEHEEDLGIDGAKLVSKLKALSFLQEMALVEQIERILAEREKP